MRIFIIDLKKGRFRTTAISVLLALVVLISISLSIVSSVFRDELFIKAGTDINEEKIIILDAGHGGEDCGAIGADGTYEKDLNLEITRLLGQYLEEAGYAVVYTRTEDRMLYAPEENIKGIRKISDLKNRCKVAVNYPKATFVSIHMNSFGSSKYSGLQVYYSENNEESRLLADAVQNQVREDIQQGNDRVIKVGKDIYVLENISLPAILIECGFLSNPEECKKLSEKEYQKRLSFSIVCGIIEYINQKTDG